MHSATASVQLQDRSLVFAGALLRPAVKAVWSQALRATAVERIDLAGVSGIDSAGVALLGWLADNHPQAELIGTPDGYEALRNAYRLDDHLRFER